MINKYIDLMLKCLKLEDKDYLFVNMPNILENICDVIKEESKKYNIKDVYFDIEDPFKKHDLMKSLDQENINKHPLFDKSIYDKYAKLDSAFLFITSEIPNLMSDIDDKVIQDTLLHTRETNEYFRSLYENNKLHWCIASLPNKYWAKELDMSEDELLNHIYDICLVNSKDPYKEWNSLLNMLSKKREKLNKYHFKSLHYTTLEGTDLIVYLPKNHVWCSGKNEEGVINNLPTLEVFTSPLYNKTEGIVYATKPLLYNNTLINKFFLEFKNGKVINFDAKEGKSTLKSIIETDKYSCYLGECALVDINSKISKSNILFKSTLFDENASCHLALGRAFNECLKDSSNRELKDLREEGINISKAHVDFMIGNNTLNVLGITYDNKEINIIKDGKFLI